MGLRRYNRGGEDLESQEVPINITPLIDVVFVILFAFIIIAPLINIDHVELAEVKRKSLQENSGTTAKLTIRVNRDNSIAVNDAKVDMKQLERFLKEYLKAHPEAVPLLLHDRRATFGTYQEIKDLVARCGYMQLDVALK
jgi:biopolymer transport protein ExbD